MSSEWSTHASFKGIHFTSESLNLTSVVIGLLLGQSQSVGISGCCVIEVSKLSDSDKERQKMKSWEKQSLRIYSGTMAKKKTS